MPLCPRDSLAGGGTHNSAGAKRRPLAAMPQISRKRLATCGAGNGGRTRDIHLGKVALYH